MSDVKQIQKEHKIWHEQNFGFVKSSNALFGIVEEVGELSHAHLKNIEGIRINEVFEDNAKDAIGDITIYMISFCTAHDWDFEDILLNIWDKIKQRDWIKYPETGRPSNETDNNSS